MNRIILYAFLVAMLLTMSISANAQVNNTTAQSNLIYQNKYYSLPNKPLNISLGFEGKKPVALIINNLPQSLTFDEKTYNIRGTLEIENTYNCRSLECN